MVLLLKTALIVALLVGVWVLVNFVWRLDMLSAVGVMAFLGCFSGGRVAELWVTRNDPKW